MQGQHYIPPHSTNPITGVLEARRWQAQKSCGHARGSAGVGRNSRGSPAQTRVPVRLGGVSRSLAPVLGLDPAKTSRQPLWPASKVTHQSACGMPRLSRLGTYLALHAPRGQASVRSSTPAAAAGEAAGSLHGSHREVRPLSMAGGVYRAGS